MKVILLSDVKGVGKKDQVVEVSNGYASNFLIPRHLAVPQTDKSMEILNKQEEDARIAKENKHNDALALVETLKGITLEFEMKGGKDSKMFGSISPKQITDKLMSEYNIDIDRRKFIDKGNISTFGYTNVRVELDKDVIGVINVHVGGIE
ncbi:MAG: 50S ribosomal protein L9 [Coprobacillus sp.]|nr:50S ribosomal protein L9 [Coprobacillus sp.]